MRISPPKIMPVDSCLSWRLPFLWCYVLFTMIAQLSTFASSTVSFALLWRKFEVNYTYCLLLLSVFPRLKNLRPGEFPGGLVVRIQHFHHCSLSSIPDLGTEIPYQAAAHHSRKKKKTKNKKPWVHLFQTHLIIMLLPFQNSFIWV